MCTHPGAKLLFMGNEFAQTSEWNYKSELDWDLLQFEPHNKMQECVRVLNHIYKNEPALYQYQFERKGFEWVNTDNRDDGIVIFKRRGKNRSEDILVVLNVTVHPKRNWKTEIKGKMSWKEIFNSDDVKFWGSGDYMNQNIVSIVVDKKKKLYEINFDIPALAALIFR